MKSGTGLAKRTLSLRGVGMLALVTVLAACKHPLRIVGEGNIEDLNNSGFGCTLEQFRADDPACTENESTGDYIVNYQGVPRAGWRFVRWEGPCDPLSEAPNCQIIAPASFVAFWDQEHPDTPIPTTVAVFELDSDFVDQPGPVTDVVLNPEEIAVAQQIDADLKNGDFSAAIDNIISVLGKHMDSDDLNNLYSQALAGSAGMDSKRVAISLGAQSVMVEDANGDLQAVTSSTGTLNSLRALANVSDTDEYRVRYQQGKAALEIATRDRNILALPQSERASLAAMAAIHATRVLAGVLGGGQSTFANKQEITAAVASNLPALRDDLVSTLQLLLVTREDLQSVYAIPELEQDPLLVNAGINMFRNTLLDDGTLSNEELADLVSKALGVE